MRKLPDWKERAGIYIVAFGKPSRDCAKTCITACKKQMPDLPVALVSTKPLNAGEDIFIQQPDRDIGGRLAKLSVYDLAPASWEYVLYLDADTEPVKPVDFLFDALTSGWELVICKDMNTRCNLPLMDRGDNHDEYEITIQQLGTDRHLQYNGGVFAFRRCDRMRALFQEWQAQWDLFGKRDQGALIRALHKHPPRLYMLTNVWNESDRYEVRNPDDVIIWHHNVKARRWSDKIPGRIDAPEAWQAVQNWEARNL